MYMLGCMKDKNSILLSDVTVQGDIIEKEKLILDGKITGDITAEEIETHENSEVNGNIFSKEMAIGGNVKGNLQSDRIVLKKTCNVDGVLNHKTLGVEEGATLKIKSETYK